MKKSIILILFLLIGGASFAQQDTLHPQKSYIFCEVKTVELNVGNPATWIVFGQFDKLDYTQQFFEEDKKGGQQRIRFASTVDAVNRLIADGWELSAAYPATQGGSIQLLRYDTVNLSAKDRKTVENQIKTIQRKDWNSR